MVEYMRRIVDDELETLAEGIVAVSIEGAKGVGKTVTARRRSRTVIQLDDATERTAFAADPERLARDPSPILLDEWHRFPASWDMVRRAVDDDRRPNRFLLTGSAAPKGTTLHSGAGRIVTVRMRPLSLAERGIDDPTVSLRQLLSGARGRIDGATSVALPTYVNEIIASGFPGMRGISREMTRAELDGYVDMVVTKEFPEFGFQVRNPVALRSWMRAYASAVSTTASFEKIRAAATSGTADKPARSTTIPYREALESLWILDQVYAWRPFGHPMSELGDAPKHHLVDPSLAARLLRLGPGALESGKSSMLGPLFESLVTQSVKVYAQANLASVGHFRKHRGEREIDLIVEHDDGGVVAIEVKLARIPADHDVTHLLWLRRELGDRLLDAVVITAGPRAYRRPDGIAVVPAALLGP